MKIKEILMEFIEIANVCDKNLCIVIRGTDHAKVRSFERHVSNDTITDIVKTAIPFFNSEIHHPDVKPRIFSKEGKYYHLQRDSDNIVGALKYDNDDRKFFFFILTVVKRRDFHVRSGTTKIALESKEIDFMETIIETDSLQKPRPNRKTENIKGVIERRNI